MLYIHIMRGFERRAVDAICRARVGVAYCRERAGPGRSALQQHDAAYAWFEWRTFVKPMAKGPSMLVAQASRPAAR
jgi:hypothetical protein